MSETEDGEPPRDVRRRSRLVFLPLAGFLLFAALAGYRIHQGRDPSLVPSPLIGHPVPSFALPAVAGVDRPGLADADLRAGRATVLNVFASWCVPCREEAPALGALSKLLAKSGQRLVGIAYKDQPDKTARFLKEEGNPFAAVGADANGRTGIDLGVYGVPETYVVAGDGTVKAKIVGPLTPDNVRDEVLPALSAAH